jgi:hypothetical protein
MLKMLICLASGVVLGGLTLQLRQQRMELGHDTSQLNDRINAQQAKLWSQQLQIAVYTAPNAIQQTVKSHDLNMVSQSPVRSKNANWIEPTANPDAE